MLRKTSAALLNLVLLAGAPAQAAPETVKIIQFEPLAPDDTRVTISGIGFGDGPAFDPLYRFFVGGDGEMLKALRTAFETTAAR